MTRVPSVSRDGAATGVGNRELRHRLVRRDHVDAVEHEPEAVAEIGEADDNARPGSAVNTRRTGSSRAPMLNRWIWTRGTDVVIDGHTSSMWAPSTFGSPGPRW